jgi:hypothetical protein
MSNHDPYSDSPSPLVGFSTTKVYSGIGADIVMESISLTPLRRVNECNWDFAIATNELYDWAEEKE